MLQILDEFTNSIKGKVKKDFWNSFYQRIGGCYEPVKIQGWVLNFFPYLENGIVNSASEIPWYENIGKEGPDDDCFPSGMCSCPFQWKIGRNIYDMKFMAGMCAAQKEENYIRPCQGWAVVE